MIEHTGVQRTPRGEKQEHLLRLEDQHPGFMDIDAGRIACQSKAGDSQREHHSSQWPLIHTLNEVPTCVIQRAICSIINRTPAHLLKEIILVDDHSTNGFFLSKPHQIL